MRVGLSVSVIQRGRSGVATYVGGLLRGLASISHPAEVVLFGLEEDREWFAPWLEHCEWVGVAETWRPAVRNILWHQLFFPGLLKRHRCDLVHIPSYRRLIAWPGRPQVVTIHDCAAFRLSGKYDPARMFYGQKVVRPMARRCQRVLTVSATTATDIRKYFGISEERLKVVYNGLSHERFAPMSAEEVTRRLPRVADWAAPWWIYVARLEHPGKNHLRLLRAYEQLHRESPHPVGRLVLIGADWHGASEIHRAIEKSPARDQIVRLGFVSEEDLPAWYAGARALVFPSLFEGFGLPPLEAMACGCPVLSSDRGSLPEVVGSAALLFDPENEAALAALMRRMLDEPELAGQLREMGIQRAGQFRWENCATATVETYREALESSRKAGSGRPAGPF